MLPTCCHCGHALTAQDEVCPGCGRKTGRIGIRQRAKVRAVSVTMALTVTLSIGALGHKGLGTPGTVLVFLLALTSSIGLLSARGIEYWHPSFSRAPRSRKRDMLQAGALVLLGIGMLAVGVAVRFHPLLPVGLAVLILGTFKLAVVHWLALLVPD